ncbi:hypothetical protein NSQ14_11995 [Caldifermentibacillus hisashii]|uniref:hypothetical protein n=1 Tax=Caldifermentibacillus hisashii TaxID=996558 RepID=UPI0031B6B4C6
MGNIVTKQIPPEKLRDFQLKMVGDEKCATQLIIINGLKFGAGAGDENKGKGIGKIDFVLDPYEKPQVFVQYHNRLITKEVAESLGLDKIDY